MITRKMIIPMKDRVEIPNLIRDQIVSFDNFRNSKNNRGMEFIMKRIFPIHALNGRARLDYVSHVWGEPEYNVEECRAASRTYSAQLWITIRLTVFDKDGRPEWEHEDSVNFQQIPFITDDASFIISGVEYAVVSQIIRSPGPVFEYNKDGYISSKIIPISGAWLTMELNEKIDSLTFQIDKSAKKRNYVTTLLRALGYSSLDILSRYYEIAKLPVSNLVVDRLSAVDVFTENPNNGKLRNFLRAGQPIRENKLNALKQKGYDEIETLVIKEGTDLTMRNTIFRDLNNTETKALDAVYKLRKKGEMPSMEAGRKVLSDLFFSDDGLYTLSVTGRAKFNEKVHHRMKEKDKPKVTHLTGDDIFGMVDAIFEIKDNRREIDDTLSLDNKYVRLMNDHCENLVYDAFLKRMNQNLVDNLGKAQKNDKVTDIVNNTQHLSQTFREFFRSPIVQTLDHINILRKVIHIRRTTYQGQGGVSKDNAGLDVRDIHPSHYGRICLVESPEGSSIGLVNSKALYAKTNELGFLETPYFEVRNGIADIRKPVYLTNLEEKDKVIASARSVDDNGKFVLRTSRCRINGIVMDRPSTEVDYVDASPKQIISAGLSLVPFIVNNDPVRSGMGANMQGQAVPTIFPEVPYVGTGMERYIAEYGGGVIRAKRAGIVTDTETPGFLRVQTSAMDSDQYPYRKYRMSNANTCINYKRKVHKGDKVKKGDILVEGPSVADGELALGANVLVAFMPWYGYNFEDSIVISESLARSGVFTSIHVFEKSIDFGPQHQLTRNVPNAPQRQLDKLDDAGIIKVGSEIRPGDMLVGRITKNNPTKQTKEEVDIDSLTAKVLGEVADAKDSSLYAPPYWSGRVIDVQRFDRDSTEWSLEQQKTEKAQAKKEFDNEFRRLTRNLYDYIRNACNGQILKAGWTNYIGHRLDARKLAKIPENQYPLLKVENKPVQDYIEQQLQLYMNKMKEAKAKYEDKVKFITSVKAKAGTTASKLSVVTVTVASTKRLKPGDKMAGRHGNKGVIARVAADEDMPFAADGTRVDMVLNTLGIPSRMNIGQLFETHFGLACHNMRKLNKDGKPTYLSIPSFAACDFNQTLEALVKAGAPESGKFKLYDGLTGEPFDQPVTLGYQYFLKLNHLVDLKVHARPGGRYTLSTQQPLKGKSLGGGQRFGEMETWVLIAHKCPYMLREMFTAKSDSIQGRQNISMAMLTGSREFECGEPEAWKLFQSELAASGLELTSY